MSTVTKQALEASLKHMLLKKPLDKITIRDLTEDCGVSRMTFYYHFQDIYDLVEWACIHDAREALAGKKTYADWPEGLAQIFEAVLENKPFVLNAYRALERGRMERFLYHSPPTSSAALSTNAARAQPSRKKTRPSSPIFTNTVSSASCSTGSPAAWMTITIAS